MTKRLHVMMLGLRGFPNVQGGVETHVEKLCRELIDLGCEVTVIVRSRYQRADIGNEWNRIQFKKIWSPASTSLEAIIHTFLGVLYAAISRPDVLHIHAIGPAFMTPLARLLRLRVVVTHHGEDYNRQKWGVLAKSVLRLGERFGMKFANARIAISSGIRKLVMHNYGLDSAYISNGVALPPLTGQSGTLEKFNLARRRYVLLVSRLVPEKRHLDLIRAFLSASLPDWKLVLVGKADHHDAYVESVLAAAKLSPDIVCTGYQGGQALHELYLHAGAFVLPSSHEGLPISILEALSYGLPVIASDIPSNREIANCSIEYFPLGDISALRQLLEGKVTAQFQILRCMQLRSMIRSQFQWSDVAKKTYAVYRSVCPNAQLQDEPLAKFCSQAPPLRD